MSAGSLQLRLYRIARRDGMSRADAVALTGILPGEAVLHDQDDARSPPGPECFVLSLGMIRRAAAMLEGLQTR